MYVCMYVRIYMCVCVCHSVCVCIGLHIFEEPHRSH